MRIAKFAIAGEARFGVVDGPELVVFKGHPLFSGYETTGERIALKDVQLLPPTLPTTKVVCVGKNYADHAAEMGGEAPVEPLIFLKPNTSLIGLGEAIVLPAIAERVDHEAELAIVMGDVARKVSAADALKFVWGYTVANDVTARDLQAKDGQWTRAKGFDTFCPLGPWIETEYEVEDQVIEARVDGDLRQHAKLSDMIHSVPKIIEHVTAFMTLFPGDVILTGTPSGIGQIVAGDSVTVSVEGIGELTNPVIADVL
jgi:2-keto-4-pentenoate hydratase/2-oxohepta-3-ene-1,7-dioic acid hydratase in catechol pathway